jgi:hypothetical protein
MANTITKMFRYLVPVVVLALAALPVAAGDISDGFILVHPDGTTEEFDLLEQDEMAGVFYYLPIPGLADPAQFGNATALFEIQGKEQVLSDIFGVVMIQRDFYLGFGSDAQGQDAVFQYPPTIFQDEGAPDGLYDATMYLDPGLQAAGFMLLFYSDP